MSDNIPVIRRVIKRNYLVHFVDGHDNPTWKVVKDCIGVEFASRDERDTDLVFSTLAKGLLASSVICYIEVP